MIKDSGERREFCTGAVRDVSEGKGRCDLLPFSAIEEWYVLNENWSIAGIFSALHTYMYHGSVSQLSTVLSLFLTQGTITFETLMLDVAIHYEEGAKKYTERNWEKGMPVSTYIDSAARHLLKHLRGDNDEPHDRAFIWNILGAIWTNKNLPELVDLPFMKNSPPRKRRGQSE